MFHMPGQENMPAFAQDKFRAVLIADHGFALTNGNPFIPILVIPFAFRRRMPEGKNALHEETVFSRQDGLKIFPACRRRGFGQGEKIPHAFSSGIKADKQLYILRIS
jgi:hypothetical protein